MVSSQMRSAIASAAVTKGKDSERKVANYFRENGWPNAERRIATAFKTRDREVLDRGDLQGVEPLCVQVKSGNVEESEIPKILAETCNQAAVCGADIAVLVVRRFGKSDAGRWRAYVTAGDFREIVTRGTRPAGGWHVTEAADLLNAPVQMELRHLVGWLVHAGYSEEAR